MQRLTLWQTTSTIQRTTYLRLASLIQPSYIILNLKSGINHDQQ